MGRVCREIHEIIEETVERPIERWEERWVETRRERCRRRRFRIGRFFCRLVTRLVQVFVRVVVIVLVTIPKWVTRIVCEGVCLVADVAAFLVSLILSIPIIGGLIRTILNWLTEIAWRIVGLIELFGSLAGIRLRKKMYFGIIIPEGVESDGVRINEADMQPQIDAARRLYDELCNINLVYTGSCTPTRVPNENTLTVDCNARGFFSDWWLAGSFFEFASSTCKFQDGWRRITGYGGELIVFVVNTVNPLNTDGCSAGPTHNYVVVEPFTTNSMAAHEIGHACGLIRHHSNINNLMNSTVPTTPILATGDLPTLTNWQIAVVRSSKHCVYL